MSWSYKILFLYLSFVGLIMTMVVTAMRQKDIFLVEKEYYKEEINYQTKLDQMKAGAALSSPLHISNKGRAIHINYPQEAWPSSGTVWLFRPANANEDIKVEAKANEAGQQVIDGLQLKSGLYRVKVSWQAGGRQLFSEETVVLP